MRRVLHLQAIAARSPFSAPFSRVAHAWGVVQCVRGLGLQRRDCTEWGQVALLHRGPGLRHSSVGWTEVLRGASLEKGNRFHFYG
jgi:hypothetical protein